MHVEATDPPSRVVRPDDQYAVVDPRPPGFRNCQAMQARGLKRGARPELVPTGRVGGVASGFCFLRRWAAGRIASGSWRCLGVCWWSGRLFGSAAGSWSGT